MAATGWSCLAWPGRRTSLPRIGLAPRWPAGVGGIAAGGQSAGLTGSWLLAVLAVVSAAVADLAATCRGGLAGAGASAGARPGRSRALWQRADQVIAPHAGGRVPIALLGLIGPADPDMVLACRDDGPAARWAGRLVRGNLIPLPPAVAGVVATALLAALGLRNLPGVIMLTPPVVMMLAAPGAGHPHDRRFDWLVPILLALGQYIYLAALGFALAVPGPAILAACALTAVWQAGVAASTRACAGGQRTDGAIASRPSGAGWETRMFFAGLAAILRFATFGYLGLAAYLGVLICRQAVIGYLIPSEEDSQ